LVERRSRRIKKDTWLGTLTVLPPDCGYVGWDEPSWMELMRTKGAACSYGIVSSQCSGYGHDPVVYSPMDVERRGRHFRRRLLTAMVLLESRAYVLEEQPDAPQQRVVSFHQAELQLQQHYTLRTRSMASLQADGCSFQVHASACQTTCYSRYRSTQHWPRKSSHATQVRQLYPLSPNVSRIVMSSKINCRCSI